MAFRSPSPRRGRTRSRSLSRSRSPSVTPPGKSFRGRSRSRSPPIRGGSGGNNSARGRGRSPSRSISRSPSPRPRRRSYSRSRSRSFSGSRSRSRSFSRSRSRSRGGNNATRRRSYSRSVSRSPSMPARRDVRKRSMSPRNNSRGRNDKGEFGPNYGVFNGPPRGNHQRRDQPNFGVYVSGITKRVSLRHLREIFSKYGNVDHIDMLTSSHAMIDFTSKEEMQKAIDYMDGALIDEAEVRVQDSIPQTLKNWRQYGTSRPSSGMSGGGGSYRPQSSGGGRFNRRNDNFNNRSEDRFRRRSRSRSASPHRIRF